jgi:hypothetical protein
VALKQDYTATKDCEATTYLGLTIQWDHIKQKVHLWMPGYIEKALIRFEHKMPEKKQDLPHPHIIPAYRQQKIQYAVNEDSSPILGKEETKYIQ